MKQESNREAQVEHILQLGEKAFRELFPIVPKEWLQLDLTMPQLKVILLLFLSGPTRMSEIATALDVSLATATGVVDRLVERDTVMRESLPEDRRVVLCRLSDKGQKMIGGLWQLARDRTKELLEAVDSSQLTLITEALDALLQAGETELQQGRR
ncbi:MAG: MarR family transcriptional regulator [Chloroflexi bacterium]|nr:MarR family transcriptional regulator [Chloroflexota bacterium]